MPTQIRRRASRTPACALAHDCMAHAVGEGEMRFSLRTINLDGTGDRELLGERDGPDGRAVVAGRHALGSRAHRSDTGRRNPRSGWHSGLAFLRRRGTTRSAKAATAPRSNTSAEHRSAGPMPGCRPKPASCGPTASSRFVRTSAHPPDQPSPWWAAFHRRMVEMVAYRFNGSVIHRFMSNSSACTPLVTMPLHTQLGTGLPSQAPLISEGAP